MASISDIIENFILDYMTENNDIELSRNDLAKYFACVPSQINYVLNTRFTLNRGFIIESVRGGAGHIKVIKVNQTPKDYLTHILGIIDNELSFQESCNLLEGLSERGYITENEKRLIKRSVSPKSLINPINIENTIRANQLKEIIIELMKGEKL